MTEKELEQLKALQAKQKRVQRANEDFMKEADARKEELLSRWGAQNKWAKLAQKIGTDEDSLYRWVSSEKQIAFFKNSNMQHQVSDRQNSEA